MKIPHLFALLPFFCTLFSFGQTQIAQISDIYKNRVILPDAVVPLTDSSSQQFAICLFEGKAIDAYLFDKNRKIIDSLQSEDKQKIFRQIFGKMVLKNDEYVVFLSNKNRKKFASALFSFAENKIEFKELDLDLEKEKILQVAEYNNKFHVLTITPRTALVNIYKFEDATTYTKFPIDFSNHTFLNEKQKEVDLYDMITVNSGFYGLGKAVDLVKIEVDNPTTLEVACNPTKLFQQEENVLLTFDSNETMTQVVEINLETMTGDVIEIPKALENWGPSDKNSNSFLYGDLLYQIVTTKRAVHLRAQNYRTGAIINEHYALESQEISFKNSAIVQTGGTFDNYREFEDTGTLLRKVRRGKAGLAVHKNGALYYITYGGVIERDVNPAMMMPGFGIPIAGIGAVTIFFNPAFFAFESYTHTKALTVTGLFDSNFKHQKGEITDNIFDRIQKFEKDEQLARSGKTVFKLDNEYILGTYDGPSQKYTLWSFQP